MYTIPITPVILCETYRETCINTDVAATLMFFNIVYNLETCINQGIDSCTSTKSIPCQVVNLISLTGPGSDLGPGYLMYFYSVVVIIYIIDVVT